MLFETSPDGLLLFCVLEKEEGEVPTGEDDLFGCRDSLATPPPFLLS